MIALVLACALSAASEAPAGLAIGPGGVVLKDGQPYRGIGVNYFSAFSRTLANPNDTSYLQGLDELAKRRIPFIRFMCGAFWPKEWKLYREDKAAYFKLLDTFVKAAEDRGIGLIPSVCWYDACVPDLAGEPRNQWGNPDSKTIAFMRQYVTELATRYAKSPAIWAWELGNEYNLGVDLPNADSHRPWIHPELGTATSRSEADDLTHEMIDTACREFAKAVRAVDKQHPVTTGHSLPRPSAQHQRSEKSWTQDSKEEFQADMIAAAPDPIDLVSIHIYSDTKKDRFGQETTPFAETLSLCMDACRKAGKGLFVGEFGAPDTEKDGGPEAGRTNSLELIAAIEATGVPLAALWVFDLPDQDSFVNVSTTNHRSYLLDELQRANERLRAAEHKAKIRD